MRGVRGTVAVAAVLALAGCGAQPSSALRIATAPPSERTPYAGPLVLAATDAQERRAWEWPGAAGRVVTCSTDPQGASVVGTNTGGAVAADPEAAIRTRLGEGLYLVTASLARERVDGDRVLFTTSYAGVARQAVIVRDGPSGPGTGARDGRGWFVESSAVCDLADFPEPVSAAAGVEIWTDARGRRVPTTQVVSAHGPAHCGWQGLTFLTIDAGRSSRSDGWLPYADRTTGLDPYFDEEPRAHVAVPDDAVDTGWSRDGRHLWLSADRRRAYVGSVVDAALWPRASTGFGCA